MKAGHPSDAPALSITRVCNACTLIQMGPHAILTDPYFVNQRIFGIDEPIGMRPADLPPLSAIIGCHDAGDHWQLGPLRAYPHDKAAVPVFTAMPAQAAAARAAGFSNAHAMPWGRTQHITDGLSIEAVEGHRVMRWTVTHFVLRMAGLSVFFGSEARDAAPIAAYANDAAAVDVAVLPVNAVHMLTTKLVMGGDEAVVAARMLGARHLFAVHDAHTGFPVLMRIRSSGDAAEAAVEPGEALSVVRRAPGERWRMPRGPAV